MSPRPAVPSDRPITRADIEAKLREIGGEVDDTVANTKQLVLAAGIALGVLVVASAFLLGRRRGKRLTTIVEIRRV
jgi:hypothetical protein